MGQNPEVDEQNSVEEDVYDHVRQIALIKVQTHYCGKKFKTGSKVAPKNIFP